MGIPKTPLSLEKRSDIDDQFFIGDNNGTDIERHIEDRNEQNQLPLFLFVEPRTSLWDELRSIFLPSHLGTDDEGVGDTVDPVEAKKKNEELQRCETFSLYHDALVYFLKHPPLLQLQNRPHSDHKKLSCCHPSHFWQVLL